MPKFVKKPVEVEAWQFLSYEQVIAYRDVPEWIVIGILPGQVIVQKDFLIIFTLEGEMRADPGDWIIQGVKKEIYPCKPDIFAATYEPVEDEGAAEDHRKSLRDAAD